MVGREKILIFILTLFLAWGCTTEEGKDDLEMIDGLEKMTVLADYYDRVTGTEMQQPYHELVLYSYDDDSLLLEEYTDGGMSHEKVRGYKVDKGAYEEVMKVIIGNDMHRWNEHDDYIAIDGEVYVCSFFRNGETIRVSSDNMPEDGYKAFAAVCKVLSSLKDENNLLYDRYTNENPDEGLPPYVRDREELSGYMKEIKPDLTSWQDYFRISYGMFNGKDSKLHCHVSLILNENVFPGKDLKITVAYDAHGGVELHDEAVISSGSEWEYVEDPYQLYSYVADYTDKTVNYSDIEVVDISGSIVTFDIPEEYLHEDYDGRYFIYENMNQVCYLNGLYGSYFDDGAFIDADREWYTDIIGY